MSGVPAGAHSPPLCPWDLDVGQLFDLAAAGMLVQWAGRTLLGRPCREQVKVKGPGSRGRPEVSTDVLPVHTSSCIWALLWGLDKHGSPLPRSSPQCSATCPNSLLPVGFTRLWLRHSLFPVEFTGLPRCGLGLGYPFPRMLHPPNWTTWFLLPPSAFPDVLIYDRPTPSTVRRSPRPLFPGAFRVSVSLDPLSTSRALGRGEGEAHRSLPGGDQWETSQSSRRFSHYKNSDNVALILLRWPSGFLPQKWWCSFSLDSQGLCLVGG